MSMDWLARWAAIATLSLVDAAWLWTKGIGFEFDALDGRVRLAGSFLLFCLLSGIVVSRKQRLSGILSKTSDYFYSATQLLLLVPPTVTLTYLAATVNAPLVDGALLRADEFMGFDWHTLDAWVSAHPWLATLLHRAYQTMLWQPLAVLFVLSASGPAESNSEFIWLFLVSVVLCSGISAALPALGYDGVIGPAHIDALKEIRAGLWATLDFNRVDGIITFPSFHAALAIAFPYAVRRVRWAFAILAPLNAAMLLSTPTVGGHYLVDVIAGVALAAISIAITHAIRRGTARIASYVSDNSAPAIVAHSASSEVVATGLPARRYQ